VNPEYFVARSREIQRLERAVRQTAAGKNENVFVSGPRGIGKSSLAGFARQLSQKEYDLIGSHCFLGGVRSLDEMVRVVFQKLLQDCSGKSVFDKLKDVFSEYISSMTLFGMGVEFTRDKERLHTLVDNFVPVLRTIFEKVSTARKKGLVLILDDLNGITDVPQFAQFVKSFVDEMATSATLPVLLVLVGIPERRTDMIKHQPSIARIFDIIELSTMAKSESEDFFMKMFGSQEITISSEAMSLMVELSGGYPMLLHEIGDAVFWYNTDRHIDESDAKRGLVEAADIVGRKYVDPQIASVLRSKTYSSILWHIGKKLPVGTAFKRKEVLGEIPGDEKKNLDNLLTRMKKLGIIADTDIRGEYKFINPLYHLYVWSLARKKTSKRT